MRFYHNKHTNITAEEQWVADYLYQSGQVESREEAVEELQSRREFCGWYECEVSNTIEEAMEYSKMSYM
jgi:hypothetical protein